MDVTVTNPDGSTSTFPGAFTSWQGRTIFIWRALPTPSAVEPHPPRYVFGVDAAGARVAAGETSYLNDLLAAQSDAQFLCEHLFDRILRDVA